MAIPSSGPVSLSQLQSEFGGSNPISMSEYYLLGSNIPYAGVGYVNYSTGMSGGYVAGIPNQGDIPLSDYRGKMKALTYTGYYSGGDTTPVKTGFGFSSVSATFDPATYLGTLSSGDNFLVSCQNTTGWPYGWYYGSYDTAVLYCTYGSSSSLTVPTVYGKQWKPYVSYNGSNTVTIGGVYDGGNTDYGAGQNFLQGICRT
jgi:hypothetical protein